MVAGGGIPSSFATRHHSPTPYGVSLLRPYALILPSSSSSFNFSSAEISSGLGLDLASRRAFS